MGLLLLILATSMRVENDFAGVVAWTKRDLRCLRMTAVC